MRGDFLTRIKASYNQFTKAEKKVADYILQKEGSLYEDEKRRLLSADFYGCGRI